MLKTQTTTTNVTPRH